MKIVTLSIFVLVSSMVLAGCSLQDQPWLQRLRGQRPAQPVQVQTLPTMVDEDAVLQEIEQAEPAEAVDTAIDDIDEAMTALDQLEYDDLSDL